MEVSSFGYSWSRNSNWMVEGGVTVEFTLIYDLNPFFGSYPRSWVRSLTYREYKPRQTDSEYRLSLGRGVFLYGIDSSLQRP